MKRVWRRRAGLWLALLITLTAVAAQETPGGATPQDKAATARSSTFTSVLPEAFSAALQGTPQITLINVHVPYEGELPGTDAFIAFDRIGRQRGRLPQEKAAAIAVYCMSGRMSDVAARTLHDLGYTNVTELRGGMIAWQRAGFPVTGR
jgi:phage shock protein E